MIDRDLLLRATAELIAAPSENPPDDTRAAAAVATRLLSAIPGVVVTEHTKQEPVRNVVAVLRGAPNPEQAVAFVNFMLQPEVGGMYANNTGYNSAVAGA
ncbi:MAG: hypothetical protein SNJ73_06050, partial [Acetobacteraceae bacterium]